MAQVTITIEDSDDGRVIQTVSYGEKFEVASNAHQFAGMMLKLAADEVAKQNSAGSMGDVFGPGTTFDGVNYHSADGNQSTYVGSIVIKP